MNSVFGILILAGVVSAEAAIETKEFPAHDVIRVEVENTAGNIKVEGHSARKVSVAIDKIKFGENCHLLLRQTGKVIEIQAEKNSFFSNDECEANITVMVPEKMDLELKSYSGTITVAGTSGIIDVKVASGDVKIKSEVAKLNAKAGSGNIEVNGLVGDASVKVGSGEVKLTYSKDPGQGEVDIKAGSGDATLFLPPKMRVHSKVLMGSGEAYNEMGDFKDAKFMISFKAGSGDLHIKESGTITK